MGGRNSICRRLVGFLLAGFLTVPALAQDSLDGYSYACGGIQQFQPAFPLYAFEGVDKIKCPDSTGNNLIECGTYSYNAAASTLTGTVSGVDFTTSNLFAVDGILVSFLPMGSTLSCNIVALDWRKFFTGNAALILRCPAQNPIPADATISYEDNSWSFYETGGFGYTSLLEQTRAQNTIRRDSAGVYIWDSSTQRMRIYTGPWQSRAEGVFDADFTTTGNLLVDGTTPVGAACFPFDGDISAVVDSSSGNPGPPSTQPPVPAPADAPTQPPVPTPADAPIQPPVPAPADAPTEAPITGTRAPSPAPSPEPAGATAVTPTPAPTVQPSLVPKPAPSHAPTDAPNPAPTGAPITDAPNPAPTGAPITDSPTVAPMDASSTGAPGWCFSSHAIAQVHGRGATRMEELQIGDFVLVSGSSSEDAPGNSSSSSSSNSYSMVYSFGHYHPDQPTEYLQIQVVEDALGEAKNENDQYHPLEISKEHLLFVYNPRTQKHKVIPAGKVKVGDWVMTENHTSPAQIVSITKVYRRGAYSPLTTRGTIVVSGVLASNYVSRTWLMDLVPGQLLHWLQHGAVVPYRLYCSLLGSSCVAETYDSKTGYSPWVLFWYRLEQWQLGMHPALQMVFLLLLLVPVLVAVLVGALLMTPWNATTATHLLSCWLGYYTWRKVRQPNANHFTDKDSSPEKTTKNGAVPTQ